jgi:ABC-type glycerol-3-phosphate transport system permease component
LNGLRQIRWVALIVSWVVDIVGTNLFSLAYFIALIALGVLTAEQVGSPDFASTMVNDPVIFGTSFAGGTFFSVLAGYVAARMAGRAPLLHGTLSSAACLAGHVLSLPVLMTYPLWLIALGLVVAPLAGFGGGWLASLRQRALTPA